MRNFNEAKERAAQDGSEWKYGAVPVDLAAVPVEMRLPYAPDGVSQRTSTMETSGCASRAPLNILETKLNYLFNSPRIPRQLALWLMEKGYVVNSKIVLNDAFIEILSGTSEGGNSLKAPVDAIYHYGVIPAHMLPLEEGMTWNEYMNPARVTKEMRDLGQQFLLRFGINYEIVRSWEFTDAVEDDLISVALHAWPTPVNGIYPTNMGGFNHAVAKVDNSVLIMDNYAPYTKLLEKTYRFFEDGYSLSITRLTPDPVEELGRLAKALQWILLQLPFLVKVRGFLRGKL